MGVLNALRETLDDVQVFMTRSLPVLRLLWFQISQHKRLGSLSELFCHAGSTGVRIGVGFLVLSMTRANENSHGDVRRLVHNIYRANAERNGQPPPWERYTKRNKDNDYFTHEELNLEPPNMPILVNMPYQEL